MSEKNGKNTFKSYVSPHENPPEFTVTSTVMGILLAILAERLSQWGIVTRH